MRRYTLKNGLRLVVEKKKTDSVTIVINVNAGSNNENGANNGISHFLEHMLFEGTKNRKTSTIIANEIEKLGGELNAYTTHERTVFFVKVLSKHFDKALEILSDMTQNPLFDTQMLEKERSIILKEINMVNDEPRFYQWILFQKALFKKHPAKRPVYGAKEIVKRLKREDLISYYKKHYAPNNIIISAAGGANNIKNKIEMSFSKLNAGKTIKTQRNFKETTEPKQKKIEKLVEKKKILNSYMVLGYKTPTRREHDSYVLDVIKALLGRGQSGKIVEEIRNKRGLAYEVNVVNEPAIDYGYFAVYLNTDKKNIELCRDIIMDIFKNLKNTTNEEISEAKGFLEGQYILENEDTRELADELAFWQQVGSADLQKSYIQNIKNTTKKDIIRVAKKYLTKNYALAVVEQS